MAGSAPTNNSAVDFEKQQAAEADAKEVQRQARLTQGQTLIDQIFNGTPVTKASTYDWSKFDPNSAPAGYTIKRIPGYDTAGAPSIESELAGFPTAGGSSGGGAFAGFPTAGASRGGAGSGASSGYELVDASGNAYLPGSAVTVNTPTGQTTGGFDDAFYNNYKQKVLDYYQPDEERQYNEAKRDLTFNLARSGNLYSSTAADKTGELAYQDALQKGNIVANANAQEGALKNQIQSNKESLINQLYATEDPTLTANLAESSAQASRLQDPSLTPAAALFTPALTSVGSAVNGLLYPSGAGGSSFANPTGSPAPASSLGTGSGKLGGPTYR